MAQPMALPYSYFADANGVPLAGGKVFSYIAGTTTPQATYTDSTGITPAANPVILDSAGRATIWLSGYYKIIVQDSLGNVISTTDNITALGSTGDMNKSVYDPANVQEQLVGLTAVQTLTNKTFTSPTITGLSVPSINGGQLAGFRNRIINGDMRIDNRNLGAVQTYTAAAAIAYNVDRFYGSCTGANVTGQRIAGSAPEQFLYQFSGAASVTGILFGQRIESANVFDLASTTATFSVKLANSVLTAVTWTAYYATVSDNFSTKTQIATGAFTVNSTLTTYSAQIALPANAINGVCIELTVGAQVSGTWRIGAFQLEPGSVATTFERRGVATENLMCLRYLPIFNSTSTVSAIGPAVITSSTNANTNYFFKVPTGVGISGIIATAASQFTISSTGAFVATAVSYNTSSMDSATVSFAISGASAGQAAQCFANNASAQIQFTGAEL